jgi:hypothetical protein
LIASLLETLLMAATTGAGRSMGATPQIFEAYSVMVRSVENLPEQAADWMLILSHLGRSR